MAQLDLIVGLCSGSRERFATIIGYLLLVPKAGFPMRLETAEQTHACLVTTPQTAGSKAMLRRIRSEKKWWQVESSP